MSKELGIVNQADAVVKVSDVVIVGNTDLFQLICKASSKSQGWMKSTKAMEITGVGIVLQVSTQQGDNVAEALQFIPNVKIHTNEQGIKSIIQM